MLIFLLLYREIKIHGLFHLPHNCAWLHAKNDNKNEVMLFIM